MDLEEVRKLLGKYNTEDLDKEEFRRLWSTLEKGEYREEWQKLIRRALDNPSYETLADRNTQQLILQQILQSKSRTPRHAAALVLPVALEQRLPQQWLKSAAAKVKAGIIRFCNTLKKRKD